MSTKTVPWNIWCAALSATCAAIGMHWDLSWHRSIGRDTFWTPAHILVQIGGILMGASSAWLILVSTRDPDRESAWWSIRVLGLRGPLGSFLGVWGGLAMVTAAPFDDWWHNAYGLDVKIFSPPHILILTGILMVQVGALVLITAAANRQMTRLLDLLLAYVGATVIVMLLFLTYEYSLRVYMHTAFFYLILATSMPAAFGALSWASRLRWAASSVAAIYSLLIYAMIWVMPLFRAEPKLGPVYWPVDHFVPPEFPLLLIVPAIAWDLLRPRISAAPAWRQATLAGLVFLGTLMASQWWFAEFLNTPAARNRFLAANEFSYSTQATSYAARYLFVPSEASFGTLLLWAAVAAVVSTRVGIGCGRWMARVKR